MSERAGPERAAGIQTLEVILTAGCNLRCSYCYQNDKKPRRMPWETLRGAIDLLLRSPSRRVEILFLGGEPLLEFEQIRQAVEYVRRVRPPGKRIRYSIVTNGTLLHEEQAAFLARHRFDTHLSFDGVRAAQDLRGARTFPALDALLDRLRRDHPTFVRRSLSVTITLSSATVPYLADSVAYFLRKRVPDFGLSPLVTHDPGWKNEMIGSLDDQFARVFQLCVRHYRRTGEVPLRLFRTGVDADAHAPRADALCSAPSGRTLAVDVDGQVHSCAVFVESYQAFPSALLRPRVEHLRMGDFRDAAFAERRARFPEAARAAGIFHGKSEKYSSYGRCGECRFLDSCSICPASIGHIQGNTDTKRVPDFPCAYNLVSLAYRDRFPAQPTALDVLTGKVRAYGRLGRIQKLLRAAAPGR